MSHLSLYEAWELIPRFNGRNVFFVDGFINAIMYVSGRIDPSKKPDLLRAILARKIKGVAATHLAEKNVTTFEQLKEELVILYRSQRSIGIVKCEWKNCRQKARESVADYTNRFVHLMKELVAAFEGSTRSLRVQQNISRYVHRVALKLYVAGLRPRYKKTQKRSYTDLSVAIFRALGEEKVERYPHLARLLCNWCGERGHLSEGCFQKMRHMRKLRSRQLAAAMSS